MTKLQRWTKEGFRTLDIRTRNLYLQHQLLDPASSMDPQQREQQFEMADALRL